VGEQDEANRTRTWVIQQQQPYKLSSYSSLAADTKTLVKLCTPRTCSASTTSMRATLNETSDEHKAARRNADRCCAAALAFQGKVIIYFGCGGFYNRRQGILPSHWRLVPGFPMPPIERTSTWSSTKRRDGDRALSKDTSARSSTQTHIQIHARTRTYTHIYIHTHLHICKHTNSHTHTHTHTHAHKEKDKETNVHTLTLTSGTCRCAPICS